MHDSSIMDESSQSLKWTSRHLWTTRHRTEDARVVKGWRLITEAQVHESSLHTFSPRHFIHTPYFNKTCIFLYISPLFYLIFYIFLCFSLINKFDLFYFLSKYMQTFPKDTTLFTKNGHVLSHPTHLFTNTYYLHTYLIYSYTHLTLHFPFSIPFPAQKRFYINSSLFI